MKDVNRCDLRSETTFCLLKMILECWVPTEQFMSAIQAVDNCRVVSVSKAMTDFHELESQEFTAEIHGRLARDGKGLGSCL